MSRRLLFSLCLSVVVVALTIFVQLSSAAAGLSVNESATKFLIQDRTIVVLEVNNPTSQEVPVRLKLDLIDPDDVTRGVAITDISLKTGANKLSIPLTLSENSYQDEEKVPWYRLRYQILPSENGQVVGAAQGFISLSEIDTPNIFALEVTAPSSTFRGARYYVHVRTSRAINPQPVKDVKVSVELRFDEDDGKGTVSGSGVTDAEGHALIALDVPAKLGSDDGELTVIARHGGYSRKSASEIDLSDDARIMVTTDKPIYQPGQSLHVRALVFSAAKRAAPNAEATFKITDPEGSTVFEQSVRTSRFGVATADWPIPDSTRLGDYSISVELDEEGYGDSEGYQRVKISRYDLPTFAVSVKPDRTYYLPQQNADVEVRADYLFGQPVKRGHVRVVRETNREWNYREQKWDTTEGAIYEGETDAEGRFVAHVDLKEIHDDLADEEYSRFTDLTFAAYFTDPTSNRTEQKRFDLRATKEAIHIYVTEGRYRQASTMPMQFYVATSYADGAPASCEVAVLESRTDAQESTASRPVLMTVKTNKYGIAKVGDLKPPIVPISGYKSLEFTARDANARSGRHVEALYYPSTPVIRVETDKSLYRPGESIKVNVTASQPDMRMIIDVARESEIIDSRAVTLHDGSATFTLPYRPGFRDEVSVTAFYRSAENSYYDFPVGSRTVLFPRNRDLSVNLRMDQTEYKPGEEATVDFRISTPDGRPASTALGVVIFDRAVEERARTDQEFGGRFGFQGNFSQWRGYDNQIGGITRKELQQVDLTKPLPDEMELVAELLLGDRTSPPSTFEAETFDRDPHNVFANAINFQLNPVGLLLETQYKSGGLYPESGAGFRRLLFEKGHNFASLADPWGTSYRDVYSIDGDDHVFEIFSAGPDKQFGSKDDFSVTRIARPYFRFTGEAISRAVERFHVRTGEFIRDTATLSNELRREGIDLDSVRDPWGQPYEISFTINKTLLNVVVSASGPNGRHEVETANSDDVSVWVASIDYMTETRAQMEKALSQYFEKTQDLPPDDSGLRQAFMAAGIDQSRLLDPWGRNYFGVFKAESRNVNRLVIQDVAMYGQPPKNRSEITPVKQNVRNIELFSRGEDGQQGTGDDFNVAVLSQLISEELKGQRSTPTAQLNSYTGPKGAIKGTILDLNGAAVAGAKVKATQKISAREFEAESDDSGVFILRNLPVGLYEVRCDSPGFQTAVVVDVPVSSFNITSVNFNLQPGAVTETVTVTGSAENSMTTMALMSSSVRPKSGTVISIGHAPQIATPRLREYFPETLVWQPLLETDGQGRAQLKFKLADNITTWKMSVISSTEDGEIGMAEKEFKAFQPFFVEHDPPRVLTEGDQIALPVVLRNYLDRDQVVDLEMKPENWFSLQGPSSQRANVAAGDSARPTFLLTALASVKDGKQRVTARGSDASDAIEKPVTVHPDGEEKTQTTSDILGDAANLKLNLPSSMINGSSRSELKIYPNLMAHVVESIEGILQRPYGCGEQTISSTYPSLLVLRRDKYRPVDSKLRTTARRYAEIGYKRLLTYRTADGGFAYWQRSEADLALSAYALRFLHDAADFVSVDEAVVKDLRQWLVKRQSVAGTWVSSRYSSDDDRATLMLTAFVSRVLALTEPGNGGSPELRRALTNLSTRIESSNEPYLIASYALAAKESGDLRGATRAAARLRQLARADGETTFWELSTSTPFHGWGEAGLIETTALTLQALTAVAGKDGKANAGDQSSDPLIKSGLLYLLKQKDRYGVWYSTQATINVLDTLIALLPGDSNPASAAATTSPLQVFVNGQPAASLNLPAGVLSTGMVRADVSRFMRNGPNQVELRRSPGSAFASVQLVANYYVPWAETDGLPAPAAPSAPASGLRLSSTFNKTEAEVNEEIVCRVKAARVGGNGYGMMLAEIGLPPGAEVDRASIESAMKTAGWGLSQYDILPDRLIVYLWPPAGGLDFTFKFRPRFAMRAKTAASVMYDYYNPEARTVVAPVRFVVR